MSRWRMLGTLSVALSMLGCGGGVIGLANAPSMNRTTPDEDVHDVVANGSDVCGRNLGHSPLRNHVPPCQGATRSVASLPYLGPEPATVETETGSLVTPWLKHFYSGFPCAHPAAATTGSVAWASFEQQPAGACLSR